MPIRRSLVHRRRRVRRHGAGFFDAIRSAHNWIKNNKIISTVGNALGSVGVPYAGAIGKTAATLGYGRRRRRVRRPVMRLSSGIPITLRKRVVRRRRPLVRRIVHRRVMGGSLRSILSAAHGFIKKNQLVSKGLSHFGHNKLASAASSLGYGKRRTTRRRTIRHRGGANYFTTSMLAAPRF